MSLFQGINVVSIPVPDLDKARAFYRDVLGLGEPVYDLPEMGWIEFKTGSAAGNLKGHRRCPQHTRLCGGGSSAACQRGAL